MMRHQLTSLARKIGQCWRGGAQVPAPAQPPPQIEQQLAAMQTQLNEITDKVRFLAWQLKGSADVLGHKMFLDSKDSLGLFYRGVYEPFETQLVGKQIRPGDVVVDVGANIGYFTLVFARLVGPQGKVYAFEPDPTNFELLKRNVERNGYHNVVLVQKALSDRTGKLRLYLSEQNNGDHRSYPSEDGRASLEIETVALDDYLRGAEQTISFIKMDIQGAEVQALRGMSQVLDNNPHLRLTLEFWPYGLTRSGSSGQELLETLEGHGFDVLELQDQQQQVRPADCAELLSRFDPSQDIHTNLLCIRPRATSNAEPESPRAGSKIRRPLQSA